MKDRYEPQDIETRVQQRWESEGAFRVTEDPDREKYYCLSMLPYPSGRLHMGHVRNYTISDVIGRYQRMRGRNVLHPMGWDAFGLPAENAAIKHGVPPAKWTYENIAAMRGQFQRLGYAFDWDREVTTCHPDYYRWEQLMFVRLFRKGLVYRAESVVNWDPVDQTVLANEQVVDGKGWRSGAPVERREIPQWFIKITEYADELLDKLNDLPGWPEAVKTMQRNWIGRSEGLEFEFEVPGFDPVRTFTTRPDTIMGATYIAVAPEHPLAEAAARESEELAAFIMECRNVQTSEAVIETMEKQGMRTPYKAVHPVSGEDMEIWVANFVLMGYGTGAIMAVPGHDQRDWEFARKYELPIRQVIEPAGEETADIEREAFTGYGKLVNSGELDGQTSGEAFEALAERFEREDRGERRTNYRLRDWGVSRQRYWGCPIPMIHCGKCGAVPVPEKDLPVVLPEDVEFMGVKSPIKDDPEWRKTTCPECGGEAERETDTFDTFVESSWYYARYTCPDANDMVDERADYWLPIDQYIGGIEHAVMHLLYFRFWHKLMRDSGLVSSDEPAMNLLCQGMVLAESYYRDSEEAGREWIPPAEVEVERDDKGRITRAVWTKDGKPVTPAGWTTMSKSKNNGVDPQALVDRFGADTLRLFAMFAAPPDQALEWSDSGVEGAYRFLRRFWKQVADHLSQGDVPELDPDALAGGQRDLYAKVHETIAKVSDDVGRRHTFNTAVAAVMELSNALGRFEDDSDQGRAVVRFACETMVLLLAPVAPHMTQVLWENLGHDSLVMDAAWPEHDPDALTRDRVTVVVQVNGKLRGRVETAPDTGRDELESLALAEPNVARFLEDKTVRKVIVVPDKLVNIVAA
jgi:leucyl-tRNA synthetase